MNALQSNKFLTTKEVAKLLHVSFKEKKWLSQVLLLVAFGCL